MAMGGSHKKDNVFHAMETVPHGHFGAEGNFDQPPATVGDLTGGFATIAYDPEKFRCQTHFLGRAHRSVTLRCAKYRIDKK